MFLSVVDLPKLGIWVLEQGLGLGLTKLPMSLGMLLFLLIVMWSPIFPLLYLFMICKLILLFNVFILEL